jgi:enoyl-CoA hydratase
MPPVPACPARAAGATLPGMSFVLVDQPHPGVTLVTLNRPDRMNAMSFDVMIPLRDVLEEIRNDNTTRVVVVTGAGRGFCSGAEHKDAGVVPHIDGLTVPGIAHRAMSVLEDVIVGFRRMRQPVIAAVNGAAIGGGLCLALAADIRIASEDAYFRAAGINNGLAATELGLSYLLPRAIGSSRAFEMMLSGRDVHADEAERIGLVSRTVPADELLAACYALADRITGFSRVGIELTKRVMWSGLDASSFHAHMDHESHAQLFVRLTTQNFEEAVRAREEGRAPVFLD